MGLDPKDQPSAAGMVAVERMIVSHDTWKYKTDYDKVYLSKNYEPICHDTFTINHTRPSIAVSSMFSMNDGFVTNDTLRVVLNVIPISLNQTHIIFSYRESDRPSARPALNRIINSTGMHQLYELSRLILQNCENFVLSPSYVDEWSDNKKEEITDFFVSTILQDDSERQSPDLFLF